MSVTSRKIFLLTYVVPAQVGDGVYEGGEGLVGENEEAATGIDVLDELSLGAKVRARAVEDSN